VRCSGCCSCAHRHLNEILSWLKSRTEVCRILGDGCKLLRGLRRELKIFVTVKIGGEYLAFCLTDIKELYCGIPPKTEPLREPEWW